MIRNSNKKEKDNVEGKREHIPSWNGFRKARRKPWSQPWMLESMSLTPEAGDHLPQHHLPGV
jgi:hypothetical protein